MCVFMYMIVHMCISINMHLNREAKVVPKDNFRYL